MQMGEHAQAIQDYTRALEVEPTNSYALYNRGITRDRMGDYEAATRDFSAAIQQDPGNADFYHNRGFSLRKQVEFINISLKLAGGFQMQVNKW